MKKIVPKKKRRTINDVVNFFVVYMDRRFDEVDKEFDKMLTREEFLENIHNFNDALQEIRDMKQNRLLFEGQFVEMDDTVANHGRRIKKIEEKVFT